MRTKKAQNVNDLEPGEEMDVGFYTGGVVIEDLKELFFALIDELDLQAIARKDDYGNPYFTVRKKLQNED